MDFQTPQHYHVTATYAISGIGILLTLVFLAHSVWKGIYVTKGFKCGDWFLLVACMLSLATHSVLLVGWERGVIGVHVWEISPHDYRIFDTLIFVALLLYAICTACAKGAICCLYFKLFPHRKWHITAVVCSIGIAHVTIVIFLCVLYWKPETKFLNRGALYIAAAALGILSDPVVSALPVWDIWNVQMSCKKKVKATLALTSGTATIVPAIWRLCILAQANYSSDLPWVLGKASMCIIIEATLLIIGCCLPNVFTHLKLRRETGQSFNDAELNERASKSFVSLNSDGCS